ncbi:MAG: endonuclease/exonuclease/phosphatase family protein, partial [Myxococcales bacterium]|nr:endonuclease/exonuclease/phosphatase family protein [Myxococcales bacterium]
YDVIVLNEVFDEEARDDFVRKLRRKYPAYVAYLGDDAVGTEDSGLMLFSRFPFQHLPQTSHRAEADDVEARNFGANWKDVAFIEYDHDVFPDNWAAKGCGFARIKNSDSKRVYNVAFTHMQASYPEDEDDQSEWLEPIQARSGQLQQIETMLKGTLLAHQFGREDVFLLGDMNIDGDLADPNLGTAGYDRPNLWEWTVAFNNTTLGGFFTDVLHDTWAFEQSRQDRGLTNHYHWGPEYSPNQGARLDYFLRNRKSNENLCVQHLTLAHNLRWGAPYMETGFGPAGNIELSDHIGVNAELNVRTPNCDPSDALIDPPLDGWYTIPMEIPGQAKWLRFDTPGTYSFAAEGAGADFEVYAAKDLTVPVPQYFDETLTFTTRRGETVVGKKFINPDPPLYVKLMMSPRSRTGSMKFIAHRANCRDREEACVLRPHEEFTHTMPGIPVEPDDRFWFEIR